MISLLRTEWLKIKTYRTFWAILVLYVVLFPVTNIFLANTVLDLRQSNKVTEHLITNYYSFPDVWRAVSYVAGYFLMMPAILLIILVTNEYGFRTHRQNVIDGWSRNQFITAKLLIVLLLAVLATVLTISTGYFLGYLYTDSTTPLSTSRCKR